MLPQSKLYWAFALLSVFGAGLAMYQTLASGQFLWDLRVYEGAAGFASRGLNAYAIGFPRYHFVYPPLALELFRLIEPVLRPLLYAVFAATILWFAISAPRTLTIAALFSVGLFVLLPDQPLPIAITTGNVTLFFHLLILTAWVSNQRQPVTLGLIFATSLIKPTFAAYFLLWLLSPEAGSRARLAGIAGGLLAVVVFAAQAWIFPQQFDAFLGALTKQTNVFEQYRDVGHGFFAILRNAGWNSLQSLVGHLAIWGVLAALWMGTQRRLLTRVPAEFATVLHVAIPFLLCLILTPRFKIYDASVLYMLALWLILVICQIRQSYLLVWIAALAMHLAFFAQHAGDGLPLLDWLAHLSLSALLLIAVTLVMGLRSETPEHPGA